MMTQLHRTTTLVLGLSLALAGSLGAQAVATYGSLEAAGLGEGSALLGATVSGGLGVSPVASIIGQAYRFNAGAGVHHQAYVLSPAVGLQYGASAGSIQGLVGYSFVSIDDGSSTPGLLDQVLGVSSGSSSSAFVTGQANYWGNGENSAQAIVNYAFKSEYYWTRLRAAHRVAQGANPIYLGAELVVQGTQKSDPSAVRYQVGPTVEYRVSPSVRLGAAAGYRGGNNSAPGAGYVRVEFLALTRLPGM